VEALLACDDGPERPPRILAARIEVTSEVYLERGDLADDGLGATP
jgi:hypothetical protein